MLVQDRVAISESAENQRSGLWFSPESVLACLSSRWRWNNRTADFESGYSNRVQIKAAV